MFALKTAIVLAMLSALDGVMAGAGAWAYACVSLQETPWKSFEVNFNPYNSENHCMIHTGNPVNITVTSSGVSCGYVGFVESKSSSTGGDLCATDPSKWFLSYNAETQGGEKSGTMESFWNMGIFQENEIHLGTYPPGSEVCGSEELCSSTVFRWGPDATDYAYFIFQPDYSASTDSQFDGQFAVQQG